MADIIYIEQGYYEGDNYYTYTADAAATLNATATISCTITNVKTLACDFQALFTPSLSVTILKNHTAVLDSTVTLLATISKTVANQSTLDTIVTLSLQADRSRALDSTLSSAFTQSTQIQKILNINSTLNTEFTQSTQIQRIQNASSTLNTQFTINADGDLVAAATEAAATLNTEFTQSVTVSKIVQINESFTVDSTQSVTVSKIVGMSATVESTVTMQTQISKQLSAVSDLNLNFAITITPDIFRNHNADLNVSFTQNITADRIVNVTQNLAVICTQSVTAERFRGIEKTFIGEVTIFTEVGKLQITACDFASLFTPTVTCVALRNHTAVLDSVSSLGCVINKIVGINSTLNTDFGLNITVNVFRTITITVNPAFTHTIDAVKTVMGVSTINSTSTVTILEQKIKNAQASISSQTSLTVTFITFKSKWYGTPRPITWIKTSSALITANRLQLPSSEQLAYSDSQKTGSNSWFTIGTNDFTLEFIMLIANVNNLPTQGNVSSNTIPFVVAVNPSISGFNYSSSTSYQSFSDFNFGFSRSQFTIGYDKTLQKITAYFGSTEIGTSFTPTNNDWFYVCLGRQNGQIKLTLNNTTTNGFNYVGNGNIGNFRSLLLINSRLSPTSGKDVYFDSVQFKIGEYAPSFNTSLADAVGTENTKVIGNFNGNLDDTLTSQLIAVSSITATASINIVAGKSTTAQATLNTLFTVSALIGKIQPAAATFNCQTGSSTTVTKIKTLAADFNADAQFSASINKITGYTADIQSAFTLSNTITRIKTLQTEFSAVASNLAVVVKIGQGLITMDSVAQITVTARRTAAAESNLNTQFGITINAERIRLVDSSFSVICSLNALNSRIRALDSSLNVEFAVTASNSRIRSTQSTQNSAFLISCEPLPIKSAQSNQSAEFTQITTTDRIRLNTVTFNTNFTQQSTGIIAVDAVADLHSDAQCTITVLRIRPGVVIMDAIAVNLTAAAKTGAGLVTIESQSECTVTAQKTTDIQLNAVSTAQFTSIIERIQQGTANISSEFTQIANGILSTDVVMNANTLFSTTVTAQKTVSVNVNISSAGGFVMSVAAVRNGEILMLTQANIAASAMRIRLTGANPNNSFTLITLAGKAVVAQCVMNVTVTQSITAGVLRLDDIVLYIKTETRSYSINNEQRSYAIRTENRIYTIEE